METCCCQGREGAVTGTYGRSDLSESWCRTLVKGCHRIQPCETRSTDFKGNVYLIADNSMWWPLMDGHSGSAGTPRVCWQKRTFTNHIWHRKLLGKKVYFCLSLMRSLFIQWLHFCTFALFMCSGFSATPSFFSFFLPFRFIVNCCQLLLFFVQCNFPLLDNKIPKK